LMTMIFNYNLGPGGRYELEFVISSCIYKIDYFTILSSSGKAFWGRHIKIKKSKLRMFSFYRKRLFEKFVLFLL
jgi:hypothetical protein